MPDGDALSWREVIDRHRTRLIDELSTSLDSERREAAAQAAMAERAQAASQIESLNQVLRRLRAAGEEEVLPLLAEGSAPYAGKLVVLVFESNHARGNQARVAASAGLAGEDVCFETAAASAVVAAIESRDRLAALATPGELSPALAEAFGEGPEGRKAYLFPIVARHTVVAMLVASEVAVSAQIELLCEAAGMRLDANAPLARVEAASSSASVSSLSWESLSAADQKLHMQAQRMARLRVAEMRLEHGAELANGTAAGNIYEALRQPIDAAREQFREAFLSRSHSMVDYLHLEILRNFAHDDERRLGLSYPGPMQAGPVHV
jgi:hypothetical protein